MGDERFSLRGTVTTAVGKSSVFLRTPDRVAVWPPLSLPSGRVGGAGHEDWKREVSRKELDGVAEGSLRVSGPGKSEGVVRSAIRVAYLH